MYPPITQLQTRLRETLEQLLPAREPELEPAPQPEAEAESRLRPLADSSLA
jgi:hypothetical protein